MIQLPLLQPLFLLQIPLLLCLVLQSNFLFLFLSRISQACSYRPDQRRGIFAVFKIDVEIPQVDISDFVAEGQNFFIRIEREPRMGWPVCKRQRASTKIAQSPCERRSVSPSGILCICRRRMT